MREDSQCRGWCNKASSQNSNRCGILNYNCQQDTKYGHQQRVTLRAFESSTYYWAVCALHSSLHFRTGQMSRIAAAVKLSRIQEIVILFVQLFICPNNKRQVKKARKLLCQKKLNIIFANKNFYRLNGVIPKPTKIPSWSNWLGFSTFI